MKTQSEMVSLVLDAKSIGDLAKLGNPGEICEILNKACHPFELKAETHEKLLEAVKALRSLPLNLRHFPFVSHQAEVIFSLTELDGEARTKRLGITDEMYENKVLAKKWYKSLAQIVHSDKIGGDRLPMQELKELYEEITHESAGDE